MSNDFDDEFDDDFEDAEESNLIFQRAVERFESKDYEGCMADLDYVFFVL